MRILKRLAEKIFNVMGYELKRISPPSGIRSTMDDSLGFIKKLGYEPEIVIDIGVAGGTRPLTDAFPCARYLWVEPLVEFEPVLIKLKKTYQGDYVLAAAGRTCGRMSINVHGDGTSLYKESDGPSADGVPREIEMVTLDSLQARYRLFGRILLKIDVQGAEVDVLEGAGNVLSACDVVILEVSFMEFLAGIPQFYDVVSYMKNKGFVVYDVFGNLNRPFDGALAQTNLLFVKEKGWFRRSNRWDVEEKG